MIEERYRAVGLLVKRERMRQGHTQESLAYKAGLSVKTVSRVEKGTLHEPRGSTYRKLAEALEVDVTRLTGPLFGEEVSATSPGEGAEPPMEWPAGLPEPPQETLDSDDQDERASGAK